MALPLHGDTVSHSPEIAAYVSKQLGEGVTSCYCPDLTALKPGEIVECSASTESFKNYTVKVQGKMAGEEVDVIAIERGPDSPPVFRVLRLVARGAPILALLALLAAIFAFVKSYTVWKKSFVTPLLDLVPQQTVSFPDADAYQLHLDGHRLTTEFWGVKPWLWDPVEQKYLERRGALPSHVSGLTRVRMPVGTFLVPRAGEFHLVLQGLDPAKAPYSAKLIFGRSVQIKQFAFLILGIVSFVFFIGLMILIAASGS